MRTRVTRWKSKTRKIKLKTIALATPQRPATPPRLALSRQLHRHSAPSVVHTRGVHSPVGLLGGRLLRAAIVPMAAAVGTMSTGHHVPHPWNFLSAISFPSDSHRGRRSQTKRSALWECRGRLCAYRALGQPGLPMDARIYLRLIQGNPLVGGLRGLGVVH